LLNRNQSGRLFQTENAVHIAANLSVAAESVGDYAWGIFELPIDYSRADSCSSRQLGRKPMLSLDAKLGKLSLVKEEKAAEAAEEATTVEPVTSQPEEEPPAEPVKADEPPAKFYSRFYEFDLESEVELTGPKSIWGRSLVLEGPSKDRICATIEPEVDESALKVAEAR
jgi:hypothetical protein